MSSVNLGKTDDYVTVEQTSYFDDPTNLKPDKARELADDLRTLADEVEE